MRKYSEIQSYQLISNYGGIGSLIETRGGALLIDAIDRWPFFRNKVFLADTDELTQMSIGDQRLLQRLNREFPRLTNLIKVPSNSLDKNGFNVTDPDGLVSAKFFPEWFFCPRCRKFKHIDVWNHIWSLEHHKIYKQDYHYTACPFCSVTGKSIKTVALEQVRFIQISETGGVKDFPWEEWFNDITKVEDGHKHDFVYSSSPRSDNFHSIVITCKKCGKSTSLKGIFGYSVDVGFHTVLRSGNNVYYPKIASSVMIPLTGTHRVEVDDDEFKLEEYEYILSNSDHKVFNDDTMVLQKVASQDGLTIISIRKLTINSVLCSYTRSTPCETSSLYLEGKSQHVSSEGIMTRYLPAYMSVAEGFIITFDNEILKSWYETVRTEADFIVTLERNLQLWPNRIKGGDERTSYHATKLVLLHTLSHILIKQLEYTCGYPSISLHERIYASDRHHAGILIYALAGSEGGSGGLTTEVEDGNLPRILRQALLTAQYCRSDPICYESSSVCYSCTLVPETTCEMFNHYLNRKMLYDENYGFVSHFWPKVDCSD